MAAPPSFSKPARMPPADTSPERTKVWTEPINPKLDRKLPVVYYLSRNGQLEHPHFIEVPLSNPRGLFLHDVINRLNILRGKGMPSMYSWSCKRSYRNGFVWQDLSEEDFIYPAHGQEYVLKGSELPAETGIITSFREQPPPESPPLIPDRRRRNQSCSSIEYNSLHEYNVYKAETPIVLAAADAATQTDDRRRRRKPAEIVEEEAVVVVQRDEIEMISPPPSDSSPETLETLMKADRRLIMGGGGGGDEAVRGGGKGNKGNGGSKSSVLMQLITCGSISFKDCGPSGPGLGLISNYKMRLPRGGGGRVKLEEKEYFSGSLVETKKPELPVLKRSTSCNADGSLKLQRDGRDIDAERSGKHVLPRKPKTTSLSSSSTESCNSRKVGISQQNTTTISCDIASGTCTLVRRD